MNNFFKISAVAVLVVILLVFGVKNVSSPDFENKDSETPKIGVLAPLSGDLAVLGKRIQNGIELAKNDLEAEGKYPVPEIVYEDVCFGKDAVSATQKTITSDQIDFIGASFCLLGLEAIAPILDQNNLIAFNTAASIDSVRNNGYIFSTNVSIEFDTIKIAEFLKDELKAESLAIIHFDTSFGQNYNDYLVENFEKIGGEIALSQSVSFTASDFRTEITKVKAQNPDVIFVIHLAKALGNIMKQVKELGLESTIVGHYEAEDPTVIDFAGEAAEGFIISSFDPKRSTKKIDNFNKAYKEEFGETPDVLATNAYDSLMIQMQVWTKCEGDIECMKQEIPKIQNYNGVSGNISFEEDGTSSKPTIFKVVKDGKFVKYEE